MHPDLSILDRILDPVGRCLDRDVAHRLIGLRADPEAQSKIEELAEKSREGLLTPEERTEYESYVAAGNFVALLQAKARALLAHSAA